MKITNLRLVHIPTLKALILRIDTDEGLYGLSQVEMNKHTYLAAQILFYRQFIAGLDPTNVEGVMRRIRRLGGFKPWGSAVSSIEIALWDIAGKALGAPVYKLLGGKTRDRVRVYLGGPPPFTQMPPPAHIGDRPEDYHARTLVRKSAARGIGIMKTAVAFHNDPWRRAEENHYGIANQPGDTPSTLGFAPSNLGESAGMISARGLDRVVACVAAVKDALAGDIEMALDCGPGWKVPGATAFANRVQVYAPLWLEDLLTGDYSPCVNAQLYRELKKHTCAPLHTGEQIYLRQNFKELIETRAVDVVGPDPMDVGGLAELKWIAEYADLHGILMAPHGIGDGPFGLAALAQVCATLPDNYLAFELPVVSPAWKGLITGIDENTVRDGFITPSDAPGLGIDLVEDEVRRLLGADDIYIENA